MVKSQWTGLGDQGSVVKLWSRRSGQGLIGQVSLDRAQFSRFSDQVQWSRLSDHWSSLMVKVQWPGHSGHGSVVTA